MGIVIKPPEDSLTGGLSSTQKQAGQRRKRVKKTASTKKKSKGAFRGSKKNANSKRKIVK